ncbi:DNA-directed DNA polymerase eta [Aspergillus candidus]|uniref:DNA polymerase eta n=1 Tax=Aspergillus candidus TaxID=41067 RepID=A0A2I2FBH1_ASPCN|nr:putative sister chromatid cohesion protein [Aspergillus candidus]PLB37957.1 putative sister chromatid cohesion protein [Aspergillus candidus]
MSLSPDPLIAPSGSLNHHSRYTHRHLQLLRHCSPSSPLRVIAHVDLDAFYAQCEMVRLQTPREAPLAVRQWDSLIAINYPAREFGITRLIAAREAQKLCPQITLQHVATFREGEGGKWAYRDDAFKRVATDKVCLDPYRAESRKILKVMKEELSRWHESVVGGGDGPHVPEAGLEKASVDEVFMDLSSLVYGVLLQRNPELRMESHQDERVAALPRPPTTAVEWNQADCLVDLDEAETELEDPDWDDIAMVIGAEIVRSVRAAVWDRLQYTCSAGVARNKMMAKLGSSTNKPDKQTIVRNRAVQNFLGGFKFTKIRMLGGKLGEEVAAHFGTEQVSELLQVPLEQFRAKLDDGTASWIYNIIRGEDKSEVNSRTQIKSMSSVKAFRPSINSVDQAEKWLRIFAADIYGRLVEDGILEHRRRPRTVTIHHRQGSQARSRQLAIPSAAPIDDDLLFELGKTLLRQVAGDGNLWPCGNLSLSVGGFEEGVAKNKAIDAFLLRGSQARDVSIPARNSEQSDAPESQQRNEKRRKIEDDGIKRFFNKPVGDEPKPHPSDFEPEKTESAHLLENDRLDTTSIGVSPDPFTCDRCGKSLPDYEKDEHDDWHFAKDLESEERQAARASQHVSSPANSPGPSNPRGRGGRRGHGKPEKGQKRLAFG